MLSLPHALITAAAKQGVYRHFRIEAGDFKRSREDEDEDENAGASLLLEVASRAFAKKART